MISPLKQKLATLIVESAQEGILKLDKESPAAKSLNTVDVDAALEHDIQKICEAISFTEMVTVMSLAAKIKAGRNNSEHLKESIKDIAKSIIGRIEQSSQILKTPPSCRDLLFDL